MIHQEPLRVNGEAWTKRVTVFCVCLVITVGLLDVFFYYLEWLPSEIIRRSFNIGTEESLGTWVSTSLALFAGLVAAALAARFYQSAVRKSSFGWTIVALFFIYISFDDAAKFHERLGTAFRVKFEILTDSEIISWFPSWGWQLFVAPFFVAMGIYLCWFFWGAVSARLRVWVIFAFALLAAAVGLDFVEGTMNREGIDTYIHLMRLTEELLEMFGTTAFLYVFLSTLSANVTLYISDTSEDQ